MVAITINKKRLFAALKREESEEILQAIVLMGVEIDENEADHLALDITPNRPDLLSQTGFTRALLAFLRIAPGLRAYQTTPSKLKVTVDEAVQKVRPATACAVARNLKLDDARLKEIIDLQEKLHVTFCRKRKRAAIGVYPMEAISGNITFTALPPEKIKFRPLESEVEMSAQEILEQHPKGKEFASLLQGLPMYPLFRDSKGNILSMPPVINSHETGKVALTTTEVFIEASGSDFRICHEIVRMICAALADMGATIHTVDVVFPKRTERTPDMRTREQEFYGYYANRRLGLSLNAQELEHALARMGIGMQHGRIKETYQALIPPYRVDFLHQVDVVEDIAIGYGYEKITAQLPTISTVAKQRPQHAFSQVVRSTLVGYGLLEAKNYHLLNAKYQTELDRTTDMVTLHSSVSEEYDALRRTIFAGLLQTLARNKIHEYPQGFFEIGTTFLPAGDSVIERELVSVVLAGDTDYTRIRQIVDGLLLALGLTGTFTPTEDVRFLKGRSALLTVQGVEIGIVGEVTPAALVKAEVTVPVAACELDMDRLFKIVKN